MTEPTTRDLDADRRRMLKQAAWAARKATDVTAGRDGAIRAAHDLGASLREIAEATGIPHVTVKRIIDRASS